MWILQELNAETASQAPTEAEHTCRLAHQCQFTHTGAPVPCSDSASPPRHSPQRRGPRRPPRWVQGWLHPCTRCRLRRLNCGTEAPVTSARTGGLASTDGRRGSLCPGWAHLQQGETATGRSLHWKLPPWHHSAKSVWCPDLRFHLRVVPISQHYFWLLLSEASHEQTVFWEGLEWRQPGYLWTSFKSLGVSYRTSWPAVLPVKNWRKGVFRMVHVNRYIILSLQ